jgi:hypothetical protein
LLSACFEANLKLEVGSGGSVTQTLTLTEPPAQDGQSGTLFSDFANQLRAQGWQVRLEGNQTIATRTVENAHDTSLGTGAFVEERFKLTRSGGWLVETYRLDVSLGQPNPVVASLLPAGQIFSLFARSLLPQLSLSLQTPLPATLHNADRVEGHRYTWQVRLDRASDYYIEYRVVRWDRIAMAGAALVVLILAGRFLVRRVRA